MMYGAYPPSFDKKTCLLFSRGIKGRIKYIKDTKNE